MDESERTRDCPYCKEEIKADAVKCKHCGSSVAPSQPTHGGICPYCKEAIKPEAIRCRHCQSAVGGEPQGSTDCGCHGQSPPFAATGLAPGHAAAGDPRPFRSLAASSIGRWPLRCSAFCSGSTLWCVCTLPGTNWISVYPCGTCLDPPILTYEA